jgi:hypothetical protein
MVRGRGSRRGRAGCGAGRWFGALIVASFWMATSTACRHDTGRAAPTGARPIAAASGSVTGPGAASPDPRPDFGAGDDSPTGLGSVSGRVPGTTQEVSSLRLAAHRVTTTIAGGFARTWVEEEIANDDPRALEARLSFTVPEGAVLTHLALLVDQAWVPAEVEEKAKIAKIFKGIVDDTVRPKDPALLEQVAGTRCSLRIFPVPGKGRRKAVFAYDQVLARKENKFVYHLPLGAPAARRTLVDELSLTLRLPDPAADELQSMSGWQLDKGKIVGEPAKAGESVWGYQGTSVTPTDDWEVRTTPTAGANVALLARAPGATTAPANPAAALDYVSLRLPLPLVSNDVSSGDLTKSPRPAPARIVIVVDASHAQSAETWRLVRERLWDGLASLPPTTDVRLFACESGCEEGPRSTGGGRRAELDRWLATRPLRGSANVEEALRRGLEALEAVPAGDGVVLYVGEGAATSGERAVGRVVTRLGPDVARRGAELLFWGVGRGVDGAALDRLAGGLSGGRLPGDQVARLGSYLTTPRLRELKVELPPGLGPIVGVLPAEMSLGDDLLVLTHGAAGASGKVVVRGKVNGHDYSQTFPVVLSPDAPPRPLLEKLWIKARLEELEQTGAPAKITEAIALSKKTRVLARHTSFVAMENDAMFAAYGITRTARETASDEVGGSVGLGTAFGAGHGAGSLGSVGLGVGGSHRTVRPQIRMPRATVSGGLPPEVVQRIVRQQFGRFRLCYEQASRVEPGIAGSIAVRFVIAVDGSVGTVVATPGTLKHAGLQGCVQRIFHVLSFPRPEGGGLVTVSMPLQFSEGEAFLDRSSSGWRGDSASPSVSMQGGTDDWQGGSKEADRALETLRAAVAKEPRKRTSHESLVRALMLHGRFTEAAVCARNLITIDPDNALAWSLLAEASVLLGDSGTALSALDTVAALDPDAVQGHLNAARAYQASGDLPRACAHLQALELSTETAVSDAVRAETLRCRATVLSQRAEAIEDGARSPQAGPLVRAMVDALRKNESPTYVDPSPAGPVSAKFACGRSCPLLAILTPRGRVVSALTPGPSLSSRTHVTAARSNGVYRVLLLGERRGAHTVDEPLSIAVRTDDQTRAFPAPDDGPKTVATIVTLRDERSGFGLGRLR